MARGLGRARKGWRVRVARWTCWAGRVERHVVSRKELKRTTMLGEAQCGRLSWHADKVGSIDEWRNREEEDALM